jgi:high-affinity Fe2+/Pb2+ permease
MKISNWSWIGMLGGLAFSLFSGLRYYVFFPDLDRAIVYVIIGVLIMAVSWLYNQNLNLRNKFEAIENYIADKKYELA